MATDTCTSTAIAQGASTCPVVPYVAPPGVDFFEAIPTTFQTNPAQMNYGVAITDVDGDNVFEALVAGYANANQLFRYDATSNKLIDIAQSYGIQDSSRKAIGVAACDTDGDGVEEIYVLNTDSYSGVTATSDRLYQKSQSDTTFSDLFELDKNKGAANYVAGRSCACVDSNGDGKYSIMVANYGGPMRLFEVEAGTVTDTAASVGVDRTTGGRALVAGPIITNRFDVFANNEGPSNRRRNLLAHRSNYLFENKCDGSGSFNEVASDAGITDPNFTGRGTALIDSNRDGLLDIVYGNWNAEHRLFLQSRSGAATPTFTDAATPDLKAASRVRTVIAADFDNDGNEELFFNNIPGDNRLFKKVQGVDQDWIKINIGPAREPTGHGTGAAVFDMDGDGILELLVSHGESASEPLTLYRAADATGVRNNAWLRILPKTKGGAPARGAIVTLNGAASPQMRIIDSGSGYLCQMEPVAHFGLGLNTDAAATWSVTVQWPDGIKVTVTGLAKSAMHVVNYPEVGTTVQKIGCQRDSVEVTCDVGDSECAAADSSSSAGTDNNNSNDNDDTPSPATENGDTGNTNVPAPSTENGSASGTSGTGSSANTGTGSSSINSPSPKSAEKEKQENTQADSLSEGASVTNNSSTSGTTRDQAFSLFIGALVLAVVMW